MAVPPPALVKITRPIPRACLPRTRLLQLVDRSVRNGSLLWVCGPPGCGKTTLVSTYLEARETSALWYRVDAGDDDLGSFFYYLGLAGRRLAPRMRRPLPLLTPEYAGGIPEFNRRFFENLFARLSPDRALVFDDYHEIPEESPLHEVVVTGLSRAPEGAPVILVSRRGPPPAFAGLRVNNRLAILGWEELRLTIGECRDIARLRGRKKRSGGEVQRLFETTDGWVAGLALMLESGRSRSVEPPPVPSRTPGELFDYFGNEIFDRLEKDVRKFLLKTAFLPDMTARSAAALTGERRAPQLLSYLRDNNLFLLEHMTTEPSYRYHPLFREFLLSRAPGILEETEIRDVRRHAAALLEQANRIEDAAELHSAVGDHASLARLVRAHAASLVAQGRTRVLESWLKRLPEKTVQETPWLLYWLGACRMPFDPIESRGLTERAFRQFRARKDPTGTFLSWSQMMENLCMYLNDFKALDDWIDRFDEITKRFPRFPTPEIEARAVASLLGGLYMRRVDHPRIEAWVEKASQMILACADSSVRLQAMLYLFLYFIWIGNFPKARGIVESARGWTASPASPPQRRILFHLFEARLLCGVAQFDDSIRSAGRGLEIASASGIHLWDFFLLAEQTSARLGKGGLDAADACLKQMAPFLGPGQTLNQAYFHHLRSWHAALEGDIPLALSLEKTADALVTECGAPCGMALGSVYMARLANEAGNPGEAEHHLGRAERIARAMKSPILEYQCLLVRADIAFLRGDTPSGLAALRNAFSAGRERGYFHYDNWIPTFMTRLCVKALEEGVEVPYAQELVRKRNLAPACPPLEIESWPWPVAIYTLGRFEILKNGERLIFPRKVQKRPLSLLKAIIAFGGRAVREEQIADAVWPELEGDMAIQSLAVALHRLRQLLGPEEAVQRQEGILGLDPRYCWVDAFAFDHLLAKAQSPGKTGARGCAVELQEKAVSLYRGPFLAEEPDRPWAISMRERLRSRYLLAVGRLGAHWLQAKEWEKARACYEQGLGVDNLAEEFYQSLMRCYLQDSRKAEALAVYRRLEKTFSSLGVEPSPKTRGLLNALRSP